MAIPNLNTGATYTLILKLYQYLGVSKTIIVQPSETVVDFGTLIPGDVAPNTKAISTSSICGSTPPTDDLVEAGLDYSLVKTELNGNFTSGDLNGNGIVDIVDLSIVKTNLEMTGAIFKK